MRRQRRRGLVLAEGVVAHHLDDGAERDFVVADQARVLAVFPCEGGDGAVGGVELVGEGGGRREGGGAGLVGWGGRVSDTAVGSCGILIREKRRNGIEEPRAHCFPP